MKQKLDDYSKMYYMKRPASRRKKMSMKKRAAQFAPFAALEGHRYAVDETSRRVEKKRILDNDIKSIINYKLQELVKDLALEPEIELVYFVKDLKKDGGSYQKYKGTVKNIDPIKKNIIFYSGKEILIEDIYSLEY